MPPPSITMPAARTNHWLRAKYISTSPAKPRIPAGTRQRSFPKRSMGRPASTDSTELTISTPASRRV